MFHVELREAVAEVSVCHVLDRLAVTVVCVPTTPHSAEREEDT